MTLDIELSEQHIIDVISTIIKTHQGKPVIQVERGSNVGEGFLGVTASVTVKLDDEEKYFFLKIAAQDERLREVTFQEEVFNREAYFYSKILPLFDDLHQTYTKKRFDITPRCVYTSTEQLKECVVMENLAKMKYVLVKGKESFDKQHLLMVLKAYSRLHACGFILKKDNPELFNNLLTDSKSNFFVRFFKTYGFNKLMNICLDILKQHCSSEMDKDILNNLEEIRSTIPSTVNSFETAEEYCTIIHADAWRNNLMFKYKENGKDVEDVKIIDFQLWMINSPIFDLLHVIHTNANSKEIFDNLDYYLNYYHSSLSEILVEMGGSPEELFPRDALYQQWKKHAPYGLLYGLLVTRGLLGGPSCMPNVVEYIKSGKPIDELFVFYLPDEEEYCQRIKIMVNHFINNKSV